MTDAERILEAEMARACTSSDFEMIDSVLERAEEKRKNRYFMTGFYHAIMAKQIEIIKYLAKLGAFIDTGGGGRQGFLAIKTDSIELLNTLYGLGWSPNTVSIIYAVHHTSNDDVLRWLLEHGAMPNSWGGGLAMQGVVLANRFEAVDMLLEHGSGIGSTFLLAAQRPECYEMMKFLFKRSAGSPGDDILNGALVAACSTANIETATWLLEQGAVMTSKKFGRELALAQARVQSAKDLEAGGEPGEPSARDEQAASVRYFEGGGQWLTTAMEE